MLDEIKIVYALRKHRILMGVSAGLYMVELRVRHSVERWIIWRCKQLSQLWELFSYGKYESIEAGA